MRDTRSRPVIPLVARPAATLLALGLMAAAAGVAAAQPASLVKDIATAEVNLPPFLFFGTVPVELDGALYFLADDGVHGRELWRSDGTEAGTRLVRDVCPGQCVGVWWLELVVHQNTLYFVADDGVHGRELWRTDGTFEGTELVADVRPGSGNSSPQWLTPLGDRLLFSAVGEDGRELWATDGTAGGTAQLLDVHPNGSSRPASFVVWRGSAWFTADDDAHGRELWTTDGTPGGTHMVRDVMPGPADGLGAEQSSMTRYVTPAPLGDLLLFQADDGVHGQELWATDGTGPGTTLLADVEPGAGSSSPGWLTPFGGEVFFQAEQAGVGRALWKTDGTAGGTVQVAAPGTPPFGTSVFPLVEAGGKLFFPASTDAEGRELWVSDGTPGGTLLVEDVQPGSGGALAWNFAFGLHALGDRLLFQADDGVHGGEPWVSDGTPGGTQLLADVHPGADWAFEIFFAPLVAETFDGRAYFFASDPDVGWELRSTGGEPGDVALVAEIDDQASAVPTTLFFRRTEMADAAGTLFFLAQDADHGAELWASDGTKAATRLVRDLDPGPADGYPSYFAALGSLLLFEGPGDGDDRWLWRSDGTEAGTVPVTGAETRPLDPTRLAAFGEAVYFGATDAEGDRFLWVSDGTDAGTHPFPEGSPLPGPWELAVAGDRLFVAANSELWATAGDAATTEKLADVEARNLAAAGDLLFFRGDDGATGPELWVSDGTPGDTRRVLDLVPGPEGALLPRPGYVLPLPDGPLTTASGIAGAASPPSAFFVADDGVHGRELWWSDGTEAGTRLLGDLRPGPLGSDPRYLTVIGEVAYFSADDGIHGAELWRSDGTEAGTFLLADLEPGPAPSVPDSLTAVYGELFFSAWRSDDGRELWRSDGTTAGTVRVQDVHPGSGSSSPSYLTSSGERLFFAASDGERGFELWSLPAAAPRLVGTKEVAGGDLRAGGRAVYSITLENPGDFDQRDNPGDELVDELPDGLAVISATADGGAVSVDPDGRTVRWNGPVPAGGTVTVTIEAAIALEADGALLANQGHLAYDGDGTGDNETLALTDDPAAGGPDDPTAFVVGEAQVLQIPTLGPLALGLLALLLAGAGVFLTRLR